MPTYRRAASPEEQLSRYREAVIAGASPAELDQLARGLDPELVATAHWSLTTVRQQQPEPDPRFVRDLRQRLVQAADAGGHQAIPPRPAPPVRPAVSPVVEASAPGAARWPWRWLASLVLLAAVLLVAGGLILRPGAEPVPVSLVATGAPTTATLLDATLDGVGERWTPLTVESWQFQPGATLTIPPLNGPQWLVADTAPFAAEVNGAPTSLEPGGGVVVPAGQAVSLRNPGLVPAALYRGVAATGFALKEYDRTQVTSRVALDTDALEALPPGESRVVFDQLTIPVGATMLAEAATGQDWFTVVSGELSLTLLGDAMPPGWVSGQEQLLDAADPVPVLIPGTHVKLRNAGGDPLTLLRLRVTPHPLVP